jgi:hypothetical protein
LLLFVYLLGPRINDGLHYVKAHLTWLVVPAVLHAALTVSQRRDQISAALRDSWLAATPQAARSRRSALVISVLSVPLAHLAMVIAILLALQYVGRGDAVVVRQLMTAVTGALAGGALIGAVFTRKSRGDARPGSRYVPGKSNAHARAAPSLRALSRWPIASAFAWATPDTVRWPAMAAMLSVMSGSSALAGLGVVGFWMLVVYMVTLCTSTLRVAREAALWLRSTPLPFSRFALAIGARSLVHQLLATFIIAALVALETRTVWQSLVFVAPWIAFVLVAYTTTIALAFASRGGTRFTILLSTVAFAVGEFMQRGVAVPLAVIICCWRAHDANRHGGIHAST